MNYYNYPYGYQRCPDTEYTQYTAQAQIETKKEESKKEHLPPPNDSSQNKNDEPIFEILGLKLYLDDLIILGLLFFLYQEEVKDEELFISLILLLLS